MWKNACRHYYPCGFKDSGKLQHLPVPGNVGFVAAFMTVAEDRLLQQQRKEMAEK